MGSLAAIVGVAEADSFNSESKVGLQAFEVRSRTLRTIWEARVVFVCIEGTTMQQTDGLQW
jgi:hypothetical protein